MGNLFPRWTNYLGPALALGAPVALGVASLAIWYWFSPEFTDVGYMPKQPIPYSHRLHVDELGLDCRYCHNTVETAAKAAIPPTQTCMNCHAMVKPNSDLLAPLRESWETGEPVEWTRVHMLPDYAFFDHSVHVANGVGCVSCHGRVDHMETVKQVKPLSMGWCLECHRDPEPNLRPFDKVTDLGFSVMGSGYDPRNDPDRARMPSPPEHCSGCHR